jgi:hypothetical protein
MCERSETRRQSETPLPAPDMWKYRPHRNIADGRPYRNIAFWMSGRGQVHERGVERGTSLGIVYSLSTMPEMRSLALPLDAGSPRAPQLFAWAAVSVKARDRQDLYRRNAYAEVAAEEERASCIVATTTRLRCSS